MNPLLPPLLRVSILLCHTIVQNRLGIPEVILNRA